MRNKKLVWGKISQGMINAGYSSSVKKCRVKVDNLKQKYRKIRDGNKGQDVSPTTPQTCYVVIKILYKQLFLKIRLYINSLLIKMPLIQSQ